MANETKKYASLENLQTFKENTDNLYATKTELEELAADVAYINSTDNETITNPDVPSGDITVDSALSETSTNPVQNRVITQEINQLSEEIGDQKVFVTPEMYGAKGDGVTDDTEAIQAAIDSGFRVVCSPKTYVLTGVLLHNDTIIDGNGATWLGSGYAYTTTGSCIIQTYKQGEVKYNNIEIRNLRVEATARVVLMAMLRYTNKLTIDNCYFDGHGWVDNVSVENGAKGIVEVYYSSDIVVQNSVFTRASTGKGLELAWCENGLICNNEFSWTGRGGFSLYRYNTNFIVQDNRILHNVLNFTVSDGALDLYGPENNYINIVGNYICGYGNANRSCNGARINGSKYVLFSGNRIETDEYTNAFALLSIHDRTDTSDNTYHSNDNILVENNFFIAKVASVDANNGKPAVGYIIRFDNDKLPSTNVSICNNIIDSDLTVNQDISIRRTVKDLTIRGNSFKKLGIHHTLYEELGGYQNIVIEDNRCTGIAIYYTDCARVSRNIIESDDISSSPLHIAKSNNVSVNGNIVKCPNANDWYSQTDNTGLLIGTDNVFETLSGKGNTAFDFLVNSYRGSEIDFEAMSGKPVFISVFGKTERESDAVPTFENLVDYTSTNANQSLETTFSQNGSVTTLPDTSIKLALPARYLDLANWVGDDGRMWYSDYRDWSNGVDVHLIEEKVFDGTETWQDNVTNSGARFFNYRFTPDKVALGSVAPYKYGLEMVVANFAPYFTGEVGEVTILNTAGGGISIRASADEDFEGFKAYIAQQYVNGTPLKFLYPLSKPYTTPIPEAELAAYKNMPSLSGNVTVSVNEGAYANVTAYVDDKYTNAIEKLIDNKTGAGDGVKFIPQTLTDEQKSQARENIGAADIETVENIAHQTITTERAYSHEELALGEKTVTIESDSIFGENCYACTGEDLVPRTTFNRTFPYNGITITRNGMTYHVEGTATADTSLVFMQTSTVSERPIDSNLVGKNVKLVTFSDVIIGSGNIYVSIQFFDGDSNVVKIIRPNGTTADTEATYIGKTATMHSTTVTVPEGASRVRVSLRLPANMAFDLNFQVYLTADDLTSPVSLTESTLIPNASESDSVITFPYQSTVSVKMPLVEYIKYMIQQAKEGVAQDVIAALPKYAGEVEDV